MLDVEQCKLAGVYLIRPRIFQDERGHFKETYHRDKYREIGIEGPFVQDNVSWSKRHVLRGLHYQRHYPQGKLVQVLVGRVFDVVVDLRPESPTCGQWTGHELSADNHHQLYLPPGLAHGFVVLSAEAAFHYKCTDLYRPDDEAGIVWNDPDLAIAWPVSAPILSPKDARLPCWAEAEGDRK